MREIELKFKIKNMNSFMEKLKELDCKIGDIVLQNDTIYVVDLNHVESVENSIWLRVRKENEKVELNLKKQSSKIQESKEIEFEVSSYEKANQLLETLGYQKWVVVNKKRRYSKYLNYNLCIDEVERLGSFVEIELLVDEEDKRDYIPALLEVAKLFDLIEENIINSHYDTMISLLDK